MYECNKIIILYLQHVCIYVVFYTVGQSGCHTHTRKVFLYLERLVPQMCLEVIVNMQLLACREPH